LSAGQLRIPELFVGRDADAESLTVQGNPLIPQMASSFSAAVYRRRLPSGKPISLSLLRQ
jgi:hypothetical protein